MNQKNSRYRVSVKRAFDLSVGGLLALLTAPLALILAILIRLDSPGPAIYRQARVGKDERIFTMFKFRSMRADADPAVHRAHMARLIRGELAPAAGEGDTASFKLTDDERVTRIGHLLRKTSLDELPQLWNVLCGEMSLVGPRPAIPYEVEMYQDWHRGRFAVLPGLTGLWQVEARNEVPFDEMVRLDLDYIGRQSLWLDSVILLRTPMRALSGRGAG